MADRIGERSLYSQHTNRVLADFHAAVEHQDCAEIRALVSSHTLLLWSHLDLNELSRILQSAVQEDPSTRDIAYALHVFLSSPQERRFFAPPVVEAFGLRDASQSGPLKAAYAFDLRLRGRPREAMQYGKLALASPEIIQPYTDSCSGWQQFFAVQRGVTALLAGELMEALRHFQEAQTRATTPGLEFLKRDALIRSALIQATFGDPVEARTLLQRSSHVPRTPSWVESTLDAAYLLAQSLVTEEPVRAATLLSQIDVSEIGEMWPFYVHAQYRTHENADSHSLAGKTIEQLKALPFPRVDGQGYTGSVFALAEASNRIAAGNPVHARQFLGAADPEFILSKLIAALLESQIGSPQKAIAITTELRDATLCLRRMELWRLSILANSYCKLGDREQAAHTLGGVSSFLRPIDVHEASIFSADLHRLGRAGVAGWTAPEPTEETYLDKLPTLEAHLTDRELQVLHALSSGKSRAEITAELFVSLNTVKSQIRSIYRKLGVSSREEALRAAAARGLL